MRYCCCFVNWFRHMYQIYLIRWTAAEWCNNNKASVMILMVFQMILFKGGSLPDLQMLYCRMLKGSQEFLLIKLSIPGNINKEFQYLKGNTLSVSSGLHVSQVLVMMHGHTRSTCTMHIPKVHVPCTYPIWWVSLITRVWSIRDIDWLILDVCLSINQKSGCLRIHSKS